MQEVVDDDRPHRVQFEIALTAGEGNTAVVAHWIAIITIASHWVGVTLPGILDDPGSFAGSCSSAHPVRGPDASQRMSFAIFIRATARPASAAWARTIASRQPCAINLLGAVMNLGSGDRTGRRVPLPDRPVGPRGDLAPLPQDPADRLDRLALASHRLDQGDDQRLRGRVAREENPWHPNFYPPPLAACSPL